ncbi:MAG: helix-turn-helix domain-containing protein [Treponema sp.]|nr:helix-turn-helix domain-containing protein [Treponema sp.]
MKEKLTGDTIRQIFSKNLKRLRALQNVSQINLAAQTGLTHNFIADIENCKKWVSPMTLEKLAIALKVEPYQFFLSEMHSKNMPDAFFTVYLDDFSDSLQKMVHELKNHYIQDTEDD